MTASPRPIRSLRDATRTARSTKTRKGSNPPAPPRNGGSKVARHPAWKGSPTPPPPNNVAQFPKRPVPRPNPSPLQSYPTPNRSQPPHPGSQRREMPRPTPLRPVAPRPKLPIWLRVLLGIQHGSSIVTFCLITAVLIVYSSTVYIQQQWSQDYRRLENLQRAQRNLTVADELLKNQLAQQANRPETGMVAPSPDNTIFLQRSMESPFTSEPAPTTRDHETTFVTPLGY
ncbi:hypothetical protein K4A83_06560 [Spirulina subsalsa FACHB-351]|uniref:Cell division protein FtsL n=1 Tax=Spirulina subsalsa FACHB-351 TaxID=234711 RepID=A0ABT3L4A4_9CYAN|nr:hypothetical protein [Spirulina subsalsa]MCW6035934.1 hypothetical protein [Spirulina subsalsa FACHB-351]